MRARMEYPPTRMRGLRAGSLERSFALFIIVSSVALSFGAGLPSMVSTRDGQGLARDPRGVRRSEEDGNRGDVLRLADPAQRCLRLDLLAHLALGYAGGVDAFRLDHARIDGIDPDAARPEFLGQRTRDCIDCALGAAVNRGAGNAQRAHNRANIDDTAALGIELPHRRLGG